MKERGLNTVAGVLYYVLVFSGAYVLYCVYHKAVMTVHEGRSFEGIVITAE